MKNRWTREEDAILRELWSDCTVRTIRERLGGRSFEAIRHRAGCLGITTTRWSGYVTLNRATRMTGLCTRAFLRALHGYQKHFAALPLTSRAELPSPSLVYRKKKGRHGHRMIDAQAARDAVEWWLACETMTQAARRMGVAAHVLSYAVHAAGVQPQRHARHAPAWWDAFLSGRLAHRSAA